MQSSTSLIQLEIIIFLRQRQFEIRIEIIPAPFYFLVVYFNGNCQKIVRKYKNWVMLCLVLSLMLLRTNDWYLVTPFQAGRTRPPRSDELLRCMQTLASPL